MRWFLGLLSIPFLIVGDLIVELLTVVLLFGGILAIGVFVGHRVSYFLAALLAVGWAVLILKLRDRAMRWVD